MQTIAETRRSRLAILIKKYESVAELNAAMQWPRTDPKLAQIRNANTRSGRGKPYQMGDAMARAIEEQLNLPVGWMDTPPTYAELQGEEDPRARIMAAMESMPEYQWETAAKLVETLASTNQQASHHK